jgi:hypothetical protein
MQVLLRHVRAPASSRLRGAGPRRWEEVHVRI